MKKFIVCVFVAALVAQAWSTFSWMKLSWHMMDARQFSNDAAVAEVLNNELNGSGFYSIPNMDPDVHDSEEKMADWNAKAAEGPFAFISVRADGVEPGMGKPMAIGFVLNLVVAAMLFWLVSQSSITCPIGRTVFIATAATVGALYVHIANWNWWHFPTIYSVAGFVDMFVTWALAGFVMVKVGDSLSDNKAVAKKSTKKKAKKRSKKK